MTEKIKIKKLISDENDNTETDFEIKDFNNIKLIILKDVICILNEELYYLVNEEESD